MEVPKGVKPNPIGDWRSAYFSRRIRAILQDIACDAAKAGTALH